MAQNTNDVTRLLLAWSAGEKRALEELVPIVFDDLRRLAASFLQREDPRHTLQPTALVNEAYLRLIDCRKVQWQNRAHFFGFAAQLMRRILVDHARGRQRIKRGEGARPISIETLQDLPEQPELEVLLVDRALDTLARLDARQASVVEMRFFAGLSNEEIAEALGISASTVKREWATARLWLLRELSPS
jgi:RNA polymerase sigma factor (TIGR02999 family)